MGQKKKVFFITYSMYGGGAESRVAILLRKLDRSKFDIKLIVFEKQGRYLEDVPEDVEIIDLGKKTRWDFFRSIWRLRNIVKVEKPDVLFSLIFYVNIATVFSSMLLKKRPKVVISERNYHRKYLSFSRFGSLKRELMKFTYRKADEIIAISKGISDALIEDFSIPPDNIKVIYNPFDIGQVERLSEEKVSHPFFEKNIDGKVVLITAGRFTPQKNHKLLIEAFEVIRSKVPAFLIIMGQGELEGELKELIVKRGLEEYVAIPGFQKNPFNWIRQADVFVLSSSWEGFGNVIVESMICGTPVVSTECPSGPSEIIESSKNGILVPSEDKEKLAGAVLNLVEDKNLYQEVREEGFKSVDRFKDLTIVKEYENVFEN